MLTLVTGVPGAAKTLYAVSTVDKLAADEERPIYYYGIEDVTLPNWNELKDPHEWFKCPDGAYIVLDEAWGGFAPRKVGDAVPEYVQAMATHRHQGHDVWVLTQHSTSIDTFVRKMTGCHIHLKRAFGTNRSAKFEWSEVADERDHFKRKEAQKSTFRYPRRYFGTFKSASIHTMKPRLPWVRIGIMAGGVILVPVLVWVGIASVWPDDPAGPEQKTAKDTVGLLPSARASSWSPSLMSAAYADIPYSAPFYTPLVQASVFPRVDGCMRMTWSDGKDVCECNDQQGNRLRVSYSACLDYLRFGSFDFSGEKTRSIASRYRAAPSPASGAPGGGGGGSDK